MTKKKKTNLAGLEAEYKTLQSIARSFSEEVSHQIGRLLEQANVVLGFPIQHRVKEWDSISEKFERVPLSINSLKELQDLVGLRIILLFKRDVDKVCDLISRNFSIVREYDTQERLKEDQFGYSSIHFVVELQQGWLAVPTMAEMGGLRAEIQVRSLAQHIWAEASHSLQYKQKEGVPSSVLRGIYRVSALLETVDLEFSRVLNDRDAYRSELNVSEKEEALNVDNLEKILETLLPSANKSGDEDYADLLEDLSFFGIMTQEDLTNLINGHLKGILEEDKLTVANFLKQFEKTGSVPSERIKSGVFYTHAGLTRNALGLEFGEKWQQYIRDVKEFRRVSK